METPAASLPVIDWQNEDELSQRAAPRPVRIFGSLRHAAAMWPLRVCLACVPMLWCLFWAPLTETAATWGIRGIDVAFAPDWTSALALSAPDELDSYAVEFMPPGATWLSASLDHVADLSPRQSLIWPFGLAVFAALLMSTAMVAQHHGSATAMLFSLCLTTCPYTFQLIYEPGPASIAWCASLAAIWAMRECSGPRGRWCPWRVIVGGLALGISLLTGGPLLVALMIVLLWQHRPRPQTAQPTKRTFPIGKGIPTTHGPTWLPVLLSLLIGILIGGWWPISMLSLHGPPVWQTWLSLWPSFGSADSLFTVADRLRDVFRQGVWFQPVLLAFTSWGLWEQIAITRNQALDAQTRRQAEWIVAWAVVAGLLWLLAYQTPERLPGMKPLWNMFLVVPVAWLTALGLQSVIERRVSFRFALALGSISVFLGIWRLRGQLIDTTAVWNQITLFIVLILIFALVWFGTRSASAQAAREGWLLSIMLMTLLASNSLIGFATTRVQTADDRELEQFWEEIREWQRTTLPQPQIQEVQCITSTEIPPSLEFVVRNLWPQQPYQELTSWTVSPAVAAEPKLRVIVTWGERAAFRGRLTPEDTSVQPIAQPRLFRGHMLQPFLVRS